MQITIYALQSYLLGHYCGWANEQSLFMKLVEDNFREQRKMSWYGEQLNITPKYLYGVVKQVSHRTPTDWIDDYVTLEIKLLLKNSTYSIKEIAQALHFSSQSFLGKYFKDRVGVSPKDYRKS